MRRWPMLLLRGSRWYYRRVIPVDLRPLVGKREIVKALGTTDHEQAKLLSLRVGQEVERQLQAMRKLARTLTTDPESLARLLESRANTADANLRSTRVLFDSEELDVELDALTSAVEDHAQALKASDTSV